MHLSMPIEVHNYSFDDCIHVLKLTKHEYSEHIYNIDAGINGRWYKPMAILNSLNFVNDGGFVIYNDCSQKYGTIVIL
jgi:hypothetical protein